LNLFKAAGIVWLKMLAIWASVFIWLRSCWCTFSLLLNLPLLGFDFLQLNLLVSAIAYLLRSWATTEMFTVSSWNH